MPLAVAGGVLMLLLLATTCTAASSARQSYTATDPLLPATAAGTVDGGPVPQPADPQRQATEPQPGQLQLHRPQSRHLLSHAATKHSALRPRTLTRRSAIPSNASQPGTSPAARTPRDPPALPAFDFSTCTPLAEMPPECQLPFGVGGPANETKSLRRLSAEVGGSWYNVSLSEGVLAQTGLFNKWHIGNAVSPYWFARALAKFAGLDYTMVHSHDTSGVVDWHVSPYFMRHLPRHVPRSACPDLPALVAACAECSTPHCLMYPHESTVAWPAIQDVVLKEMREAFETWMPLNKMTRPKFEANDVVIQDRCDQTTLLAQWMYGPAAFRYYDVLRNHSNVRNIYIIRDPNTRGAQRKPFVGRPFYPCQAIHAALCSYLSALVPNAKIHSGGHKDINADFASVVYAPILFRGVSTFSLWGGLANRGVVYSTALFTGYCHNASRRPDFGPNWRYVDVPYLDAASVAKIPGPKLHVHQVHRIINWLMTS